MADVSPSVAACMSDMASEILTLRARLAEVEAERDGFDSDFRDLIAAHAAAEKECADLRTRLAAVEALCDSVPPLVVYGGGTTPGFVSVERVRAAARGEDDRG